MVGWRLPSPTWPKTGISSPWRAAISRTRAIISATARRGRDGAPGAPQPLRLRRVARDGHRAGAVLAHDRPERGDLLVDDALVVAVGAEDQDRVGVERQAAGRHHRGDRVRRVGDAVEHRQRRARVRGFRQQSQGDLGDRAERALRAGEQPAPVRARTVSPRPRAASSAHIGAVRRSCQTMALATGLPVARSPPPRRRPPTGARCTARRARPRAASPRCPPGRARPSPAAGSAAGTRAGRTRRRGRPGRTRSRASWWSLDRGRG